MIKITGIPMMHLDFQQINRALLNITKDINTSIHIRTQKGVDVDNNAFKPYSKGYKAQKQRLGKTGDIVQLKSTGKLMQSIKIDEIPDGYKIYIADANRDQIGAYHNFGLGNNPERRFFGINKENAEYLYKKWFSNLQVIK